MVDGNAVAEAYTSALITINDALDGRWSKGEHTLWLLSSKKERKEEFFTRVIEGKNFRTNALVQDAVGQRFGTGVP